MTEYDIIFLKPTKFEDCTKCIKHVKDEKIVHINLSAMDSEKSQRILDFISGAVHIQEAQIINPSEKIYCSIPKGKSYIQEYRESTKSTSRVDEEEEIIPKYK